MSTVLVNITTHFCWGTLGMELLVHRVCVYSALIDTAKQFSKVSAPLHTSTSAFSLYFLIVITRFPKLFLTLLDSLMLSYLK